MILRSESLNNLFLDFSCWTLSLSARMTQTLVFLKETRKLWSYYLTYYIPVDSFFQDLYSVKYQTLPFLMKNIEKLTKRTFFLTRTYWETLSTFYNGLVNNKWELNVLIIFLLFKNSYNNWFSVARVTLILSWLRFRWHGPHGNKDGSVGFAKCFW